MNDAIDLDPSLEGTQLLLSKTDDPNKTRVLEVTPNLIINVINTGKPDLPKEAVYNDLVVNFNNPFKRFSTSGDVSSVGLARPIIDKALELKNTNYKLVGTSTDFEAAVIAIQNSIRETILSASVIEITEQLEKLVTVKTWNYSSSPNHVSISISIEVNPLLLYGASEPWKLFTMLEGIANTSIIMLSMKASSLKVESFEFLENLMPTYQACGRQDLVDMILPDDADLFFVKN